MANFTSDNLGLNNISLIQLNNNHKNYHILKSNIERNIEIAMSGLSRIPKLAFGGTKRPPQTSGTATYDPTSVQDNEGTGVKSAPPSRESSPLVGRSKSLRLPRKQYEGGGVLGSTSASKLESGKRYRGLTGSLKEKDSSCSPDSSRASSPGITTAIKCAEFSRSAEVGETFPRRRAQSFGPKVRRPTNNRQLKPPATLSRDHTSTPNTPRSVTPSSLPVPSSRKTRGGSATPSSGSRLTHIRSRSSLGTSDSSCIREEDASQNSIPLRRADSNDMLDGGVVGTLSLVGQQRVNRRSGVAGKRGKRPNSYVMGKAADLNQLAHEITSSMDDDSSLSTPEVKSVSRAHPATRYRDLTSSVPSGRGGVASGDHTPSAYTQGKLSSRTRSASTEKLHATPQLKGNRFNFQQKVTPETGASGKNGRIRMVGSGGPREEKRGVLNSRSSTPSSGRSSPVSGGDRKISTNETTPAGGPGRLPGTGLRSTQKRIVRVREARPVGINELEGAVLMDSDEYLKISHEVKALKTAILKLKRELQPNLQVGGHVIESGSTPLASKTPRRSGFGGQKCELSETIDKLTAEKVKAQEQSEKHKKDLQTVSEKLETVTSDLRCAEEEKSSLSQRLQEIEKHRDLLLDKVERLHADKHKLEDRLSSLEKAQFYEESTLWMVEEGGEEEGGEWEETLMLKGEKTESDIGENSDPESSAVCSGPHS